MVGRLVSGVECVHSGKIAIDAGMVALTPRQETETGECVDDIRVVRQYRLEDSSTA